VSNDSVHDYELEHLPTEAWPPTPWFINWALGLDVFETDREHCPVELRWLVFRKKPAPVAAESPLAEKCTKLRSTTGLSTGVSLRPRRFDTIDVRKALLQRLKRRWLASGSFTFPAVPGLRDHYVNKCLTLFEALGRGYARDQRDQAGQIFERILSEAYVQSPRSNIVVNYEAPMGTELHYAVTADAVPLAAAYEDWLDQLPPPLFGDYPDARLLALLDKLKSPSKLEVLDLGAGTGRNALYLAERGHSVRAIEMTPKLAEVIRSEAQNRQVSVLVETIDLFDALAATDHAYSVVSQVISATPNSYGGSSNWQQIGLLLGGTC
jgi:protein-L-isoaspartate O-methyltransferase